MFKRIKRTSLVLGIALTAILGMSYGTFIFTTNSYRSTEMLVGNLTYGIEITSTGGSETINGTSVSLTSGKTSTVLLKITSLNKIISKYGVDYKITKGTGTVKYASNTGWLPTGKISENNVGTYEKVVKVVIAAETDMSVDFTVTGGFTNNELTEVETGYTRITEKADNVISYNDTLTNVVKKETTNNIYGGESTNNYAQYPINEDNTKNIWRILGTYNGIGTKIVSNQVSTTTKSTLSTDLTSFYNTLEKPDNYILSTDKFACTNTSCTSSSYSKVGLISTSEYEMLGGINSYLASSESYFALDNGTIKNITSGGTLSGTTLTVKNVTSARTCSITFKKDNPFTSGTLTYQLYKDKTTRLTSARGTGYNTVYTSDNTKTLYTSTENGTTVYYFAGNATDNWVKFGKNASNQDLYWRIIRTNSDGGVRLLYHGTSTTATDAYIGTSAFNRSYNDIAYVSYMFGSTGSISNARENTTNSTIKTTIDNWYTSNLEAKGYTKYLSRTAVYCNDRSTSDNKYFGAYTRLSINRTPTYDCTDTNDKFTVDTSTGNGKLTYPIALMTADEVSFAGGVMYTEAPTWYYYNSANGSSTGDTKWLLLSPYSWNGDANVSFVNGSSYPGGLNSSYVDSTKGVRPAISLKSCTLYSTGNGSASDPYTIEESTSGC